MTSDKRKGVGKKMKGKAMIKKLTKWMPIPLILSKSENF